MEAVRSDAVSPAAPRIAARVRAVAYWAFTLIVALEMAAGAMWDLLRIQFVTGVFAHLGYPVYMLSILGAWKLPCAAALLAPGFPRLKEWAYAGALFLYTGAAASHFFSGDRPGNWIGPLVFGAMTLASSELRPDDRRLRAGTAVKPARPVAWIATAATLAVFVVIALLTLPKGPPPGP